MNDCMQTEPAGSTTAEPTPPAGSSEPEAAAEPAPVNVPAMSPREVVDTWAGLVKSTGQNIAEKSQYHIDLEDLIAWGYQGLLEAHERFDATREVSFASFAFYRVRGAMYDGLRAAGWGMRGTAIRIQDSIAVNDYLESSMMANSDGPDTQTFDDCVNYLDHMVGDCVTICLVQHEHLELVSKTEDAGQRRQYERDELAEALNAAVAQLSDNEQDVLVRYHVRDESMSNIAQDLGYSKSWVSRINARAIDKVKTFLFEDNDDWELYMVRG